MRLAYPRPAINRTAAKPRPIDGAVSAPSRIYPALSYSPTIHRRVMREEVEALEVLLDE